MAEGKNLLERLPDLNVEDREAIAGAVGVGPSGLLTKYRYYRDAGAHVRNVPKDGVIGLPACG
jgi:hypothetical protein